MDHIYTTLLKLGFEEKEIRVYLALLELGPTAIRKIAEKAEINRGTTYESLKNLQKLGLVSYFHKDKHQHFTAEDPKHLRKILAKKKQEIEKAELGLDRAIPDLYSLAQGVANRPVVTFYENHSGIRSILTDVLDSTEETKDKKYVVYSSSSIRPYLYHIDAFPDFTEKRIRRGISVRTIASGPGGTTQGKDERKWLTKKESSPTYTLIYAGKVAMVSIGENNIPHGLIIEDEGIFKTQKSIFDALWQNL